jgi:O-antigen/teichoic acid export membrane protein
MSNKKISNGLWSAVFNYTSFILGFINAIYLMPKLLSFQDIGKFRVIIGVLMVMIPFIQIGSPMIVIKYSPSENAERQSKIFSSLLLFQIILFLISMGLYLFFPGPLDSLVKSEITPGYLIYAYPILLGHLLVGYLSSILRSKYKEIYSAFSLTVCIKIIIIISTISYYFSNSMETILITYGVIINLYSIFLAYLITKEKGISLTKGYFFHKPEFDLKEISTYGIIIFVSGASGLIVQNADTLMTNHFLNNKMAGIYSTIFFISVTLDLPKRVITNMLTPYVSQSWKDNNLNQIKRYYTKSSQYQGLLAIFFAAGLFLCIDDIFNIIPKGYEYVPYKNALFILVIAKTIDLSFGMNNEILVLSKAYRYNLVLTLILLVLTITTNYIFIPLYGLKGTALATLITVAIYNLVRSFILYYKYKIQPFNLRTTWILIFGACGFIMNEYKLDLENSIYNILVNGAIWTLFFGLVTITFKLMPDLTNEILKKFKLIK